MATAEGRTSPFAGPDEIDVAVLETFAYEGPEQRIVTETKEFSAVCPYIARYAASRRRQHGDVGRAELAGVHAQDAPAG